MTTAAKLSIPRGKRTRGDPLAKVLQLPHIIALQAKADRHIGHRQYTQIRNERRTAIRAALATSFRDRITKLNTAEPHIWSVLKSVGERTKPPTPPLEFDSRDGQRIVARSNKEKAEALADIYTRPSIGVRKPHRIGAGSNQHNVSTMEVQTAISQLNSGRAPGEDGLYADFFKHIGPRALSLLTLLIRKSLRTSVIPPEWKTSIVIPIPKPGKAEFRPISLTSVCAKLAERVVANRLEPILKLSDRQFGYRKTRNTADVLFSIVNKLQGNDNTYQREDRGGRKYFNTKLSTTIAIDFTKAFDFVDHTLLMRKLKKMKVPTTYLRWIRSFLSDRTLTVNVNNITSRKRVSRRGVPQGTILGPILWCVYVDDLLTALSEAGIEAWAYADDLTIVVDTDSHNASRGAEIVTQWSTTNKIDISRKTDALIFARQSRKVPKNTSLAFGDLNVPIKTFDADNARMKLLGLTLDPYLDFNTHADNLIKGVNKRITQLRAVCGSQWGPNTQTICTLFKGYIEPLFRYGLDVYWPMLSPTKKESLRITHRRALRLVTGCLSTTANESIYLEASCQSLDDLYFEAVVARAERDRRLPETDDRRTQALSEIVRTEHLPNYQIASFAPGPDSIARQVLEPYLEELQKPKVQLSVYDLHIGNTSGLAENVSFHVDQLPSNYTSLSKRKMLARKRNFIDYHINERRRQYAYFSEYWCDASVSVESGTAAGAYGHFTSPRQRHGNWHHAICSSDTCSFRAEGETIRDALLHIVSRLTRISRRRYVNRRILIASDSLSHLPQKGAYLGQTSRRFTT